MMALSPRPYVLLITSWLNAVKKYIKLTCFMLSFSVNVILNVKKFQTFLDFET